MLPEADVRRGIHHVLAAALARAVVLFDIPYAGVFADVKGMDAAVLARRLSAVVDAAARDDEHVRAVLDIKVVIDLFLIICLGDDDGDVDALPLRLARDEDIDPRLCVPARLDADVRRAAPAVRFTVLSDIVRPVRHLVQIGDLQ